MSHIELKMNLVVSWVFHLHLLLSSWKVSEAVSVDVISKSTSSSSVFSSGNDSHPKRVATKHRILQVHVIHRHGDRTPITPLINESMWESELIPEDMLAKLSDSTEILRASSKNDDNNPIHLAAGKGPFGKLTKLGLLQMVELGTRLREELLIEEEEEESDQSSATNIPKLFHSCHNPLLPHKLQVFSTDFPRTIQSIQGTLLGLFPSNDENDVIPKISIDVRHTAEMIPDPQPRQTLEQMELEKLLSQQPHIVERDQSLLPLAQHMTQALKPWLAEGAFDVSFGIAEDTHQLQHKDDHDTIETSNTHGLLRGSSSAKDKPKGILSWAQLSEITKCLQVRNQLPPTITMDHQRTISDHTAWRWMELLHHPRLVYLAMNAFTTRILTAMKQRCQVEDMTKMHETQSSPHLILYSAHDSSLIGLLCAFRLERPTEWPEYASYLKIELLEVSTSPLSSSSEGSSSQEVIEYYVSFSLNGQVLRCQWDDPNNQEPQEMINLATLLHNIATIGTQPESPLTQEQ
jgi:Histidine phosphatase superfamily (branch 2)